MATNQPLLQLNPESGHGGVWPSRGQELLLQAALLEAPAAPQAWKRWQEVERLDHLDPASWKLLALAYQNLTRLGVRDAALDDARAIYRYHWARNQKLFHHTGGFLDELAKLGMPALILKGVAMSHLYYRDVGARPMEDLDILVSVEDFWRLAEHLVQAGWSETEDFDFTYFNMNSLPSLGFVRADGFSVDLHGHVLHADCSPGADVPFWAQAQSWTLKDRPAQTLCPEDHLLHVISHGIKWNEVPPCRWVSDAWWIIHRTGDAFDWNRLVGQAQFHRNSLWLYHGLERMQAIVPVPIPDGVLTRLRDIPTTVKRRVDFICDLQPDIMTLSAKMALVWTELKKDPASASLTGLLGNMRTYWIEAWGVTSVFMLPFAFGLMLARYAWDRFKKFAAPRPALRGVLNFCRDVLHRARQAKAVLRK